MDNLLVERKTEIKVKLNVVKDSNFNHHGLPKFPERCQHLDIDYFEDLEYKNREFVARKLLDIKHLNLRFHKGKN